MIPRTLTGRLQDLARQYPVVTVSGPRQSGKTTLVRSTFTEHDYASLEEPDLRSFALEDPRGFLDRYDTGAGVILDEIQRTPELFSYLQGRVDQDDRPGRYVLTGSQNFLLLDSVSQSLAGRTAILSLLPLSLSELEGRLPLEPQSLGEELPSNDRTSRFDLFELLWTGGYPRIHDRALEPTTWLESYFRTYVERDVRQLTNVGDLETFGRFVRLCAGRTGQLLNLSSLANDAGVTHSTARRWISILEASFVVKLLGPHHESFNKRLTKSPKLYFLDSGLLCYLLGIRAPAELEIHASRGNVFESFVVSELWKASFHRGREPELTFWRDSAGHEIDIVSGEGPRRVAIEVKSGKTYASDFIKGLRFWRESLAGEDARVTLITGGDESFRRSNVPVLSWRVL
ncbi:MAG: ATP-binding protein [Planctomycetota bacterium]